MLVLVLVLVLTHSDAASRLREMASLVKSRAQAAKLLAALLRERLGSSVQLEHLLSRKLLLVRRRC